MVRKCCILKSQGQRARGKEQEVRDHPLRQSYEDRRVCSGFMVSLEHSFLLNLAESTISFTQKNLPNYEITGLPWCR
jgi:hypothetical protein